MFGYQVSGFHEIVNHLSVFSSRYFFELYTVNKNTMDDKIPAFNFC